MRRTFILFAIVLSALAVACPPAEACSLCEGIPLRGGAKSAEYAKKAMALDAKKTAENLPFFFAHLDDTDPEVASDAFLEFARASDADVLKAAAKLDPAKLRTWISDPKTPAI